MRSIDGEIDRKYNVLRMPNLGPSAGLFRPARPCALPTFREVLQATDESLFLMLHVYAVGSALQQVLKRSTRLPSICTKVSFVRGQDAPMLERLSQEHERCVSKVHGQVRIPLEQRRQLSTRLWRHVPNRDVAIGNVCHQRNGRCSAQPPHDQMHGL